MSRIKDNSLESEKVIELVREGSLMQSDLKILKDAARSVTKNIDQVKKGRNNPRRSSSFYAEIEDFVKFAEWRVIVNAGDKLLRNLENIPLPSFPDILPKSSFAASSTKRMRATKRPPRSLI